MGERGPASGLGVGAWAAALFALLFGVAGVNEALDRSSAAHAAGTLLFLCSLAVTAGLLVGIRRRLRDMPGELPAKSAVWILAVGGVSLVASLAVSSFWEPAVSPLIGVFFASLPASRLVACLAVRRLPRVPLWTAPVGIVNGIGSLALVVYSATPLQAPGIAMAIVQGFLALTLAAFWIGVWVSASRESYVPRSVILVALLFLTLGLLSLVAFLAAQFGEPATTELAPLVGIAQIGVGKGLLLGRRSSRRWAYFWLGLWTVVWIGLAVDGWFKPSGATASFGKTVVHGWAAVPWLWAVSAVVVAVSASVARALRSKSVSDYIDWSERVRMDWRNAVAETRAASQQTALAPVEQALRADAASVESSPRD